jgi:LacI family transcriptional regulator
MELMAKKPTLRDIALQADVALSTVSQVLNNRPGVSPELRQRVLDTATDLGYRHKISSTSPMTTDLSVIGILTKRQFNEPPQINPFYAYVILGTERECQRLNISMMYANIEVDEDSKAQNWPAMLLDQRVDGVIVVGAFLEETIADISRQAGQRIVLVDAYTSDQNSFDSVLIDNFGGAMSATKFLLENGHRHIGMIGSHEGSYPSILERRDGYLAALRTQGVTETYIEESWLDRPSAVEATMRLMSRAPQISAIFAANDNCAVGVISALNSLGRRVPEDVSVIGFDDIDLAQETVPTLTTIHVDKVLMGALALRQLRDLADFPDRPTLRTMVSTQLIVRDSVRRLTPE